MAYETGTPTPPRLHMYQASLHSQCRLAAVHSMNGAKQDGKRKRRFFAARLGIEEEDEEIPRAHHADKGANSGEMVEGASVSLPQWLQSISQVPGKKGVFAGESGLDLSSLEALPQNFSEGNPDELNSQGPWLSGVFRSGLDTFASSQSDESSCLWSMLTSTGQPIDSGHTPHMSNSTLDQYFQKEIAADALRSVMVTPQQWDRSFSSSSFVVEGPCWETLLGDLVVNSECTINDAPASMVASPGNSPPSVTPPAGTEVSLLQDSSREQEGLAMLERPRRTSSLCTHEVLGSQPSRHQGMSRTLVPAEDTGAVASCQPGGPLGRRGDAPQRPQPCGSRTLEHGKAAAQSHAQTGGSNETPLLTAPTSGVTSTGCLKVSGGEYKSRREIPSTSWMLLGGHMWEKGLIPDLTSLSITDAEEDSTAGKAEQVYGLEEASQGGRTPDQLQANHSVEQSREIVWQTAGLSEGLKATLGCLQERDKKRKLVEGSLFTTSMYSKSSAQSGLSSGVSNELLSIPLTSDYWGQAGGREGTMVAASGSPAPRGVPELSVPGFIGGGGIRDIVLGRLLQAARALNNGNRAQLLDVCALLRPHAKRLGTASQRMTDLMLKMLTLRAEGQGVAFLKKPTRCSVKDAEKSMFWQHTALPSCVISFTSIAAEIMPKLVGKPKVHIVSFGDSPKPFLPILVRMLASQTREPRLKSLKVTTVSYFKILWRHGKNVFGVRDQSRAARAVAAAAAECGLAFEYQGIEVEEENMEVLETVEHEEGVPVAVVFMDSLKNAPDNVGKGALTETMKCVVSLEPQIVAAAEVNLEASQSEFVPRFMNSAMFMWELYRMHDATMNDQSKPTVHLYEQLISAPAICNVVACEGGERRMWPRSQQGWQEHFESWGFVEKMANRSTLHYASAAMQRYPPGYSIERSGKSVSLLWSGVPMHFISFFVPKK